MLQYCLQNHVIEIPRPSPKPPQFRGAETRVTQRRDSSPRWTSMIVQSSPLF
ncbi:hypothetical protein BO99DRAFT_71258 [Aspergillus violaceofuscus CBS 115571]|uniref:Uncharacterized protein n=1 Tax=Aspergillus violaceofuscus (strain CBS 115571) TaxID=1450538 RepID=A0A2V5HB29_ASPV1|nr:hypothetical protein BO99DRAFT_71258 [Aspergillus violaceofuscus CBS 115571]